LAHLKVNHDRDGEFGEESEAFTLTKPVNLGVLDVELQNAMGWDQVAGLMAEGDPAHASEKKPVTIWVMRDVDAKGFSKVVTAHDNPKPVSEAFVDLVTKASAGEKLTSDELQDAVRGLLTRHHSP
jgi:hypothetical protein